MLYLDSIIIHCCIFLLRGLIYQLFRLDTLSLVIPFAGFILLLDEGSRRAFPSNADIIPRWFQYPIELVDGSGFQKLFVCNEFSCTPRQMMETRNKMRRENRRKRQQIYRQKDRKMNSIPARAIPLTNSFFASSPIPNVQTEVHMKEERERIRRRRRRRRRSSGNRCRINVQTRVFTYATIAIRPNHLQYIILVLCYISIGQNKQITRIQGILQNEIKKKKVVKLYHS